MTTTPKRILDHDEYIATLLSWGRPAILRLCRSIRVSAGSIKDTREIAELLWHIVNTKQQAERS